MRPPALNLLWLLTVSYYTRQENRRRARCAARAWRSPILPIPMTLLSWRFRARVLLLPAGRQRHSHRLRRKKTGYTWSTSIGKILVKRGILQAAGASLQSVFDWMRADPDRGRKLMWENKSYPFFRVCSRRKQNMARARTARWAFRSRPAAASPSTRALISSACRSGYQRRSLRMRKAAQRLMIAQDTGSAIRGPVRGDIFWGSGAKAGRIKAKQNTGDFYVLIPN